MADTQVAFLVALLVAIPLVALARRIDVPYPITLVLGGLTLGFVPHFPALQLDPNLVLLIFLPPLLYWEAVTAPTDTMLANWAQVASLAIGLVIATTIAVGVAIHAVVPSMPWAVAMVLGAIVAPTDELASAPIMERFRLPRHLIAIVQGESLVNDALSLVLYGAAVTAAMTSVFHLGMTALYIVLAAAGSIVVGLLVGRAAVEGWRRINDTQLQSVISLLLPFASYLGADHVGISGVLSVVTAGIVSNRATPTVLMPATRLRGAAFWETFAFLANAVLFVLVGLQLRAIATTVFAHYSWVSVLWYTLVVNAVVIVVRFIWLIGTEFIPFSGGSSEHPEPNWRHATIAAWSGFRGAVSLAAALAIPATLPSGAAFPDRDLVIFLTFTVIVVTLVAGGFSLPAAIRYFNRDDEPDEEAAEMQRAQLKLAEIALETIDALERDGGIDAHHAVTLRLRYTRKRRSASAQLTQEEVDDERRDAAAERRVIAAERRAHRDATARRDRQHGAAARAAGAGSRGTADAALRQPRRGRGKPEHAFDERVRGDVREAARRVFTAQALGMAVDREHHDAVHGGPGGHGIVERIAGPVALRAQCSERIDQQLDRPFAGRFEIRLFLFVSRFGRAEHQPVEPDVGAAEGDVGIGDRDQPGVCVGDRRGRRQPAAQARESHHGDGREQRRPVDEVPERGRRRNPEAVGDVPHAERGAAIGNDQLQTGFHDGGSGDARTHAWVLRNGTPTVARIGVPNPFCPPRTSGLTRSPASWYTAEAEAAWQHAHRPGSPGPVPSREEPSARFGSYNGVASASPFFLAIRSSPAIARPLRVNEQIRIRQVRVIDDAGEQLGVIPTEEALNLARQKGLDLIEVSPTAVPPVCKIGDYGRLKYEQSKKDKDARKKHRGFELREVKLRPKIDIHDYQVKARMAERLLMDGGKVKVTIMFRGREITYTAFGKRLLDRIAEDLKNVATMEREAKLEGKNMFLILAPRATPLGPPKFYHPKAHEADEPLVDDSDVHLDDDDDADEPESGAPLAGAEERHEVTTNSGSPA